MSRRPLLQLVPTWLPSALLVIAAAAGFWVLSHGMSAGTATITGYAEEQVHSIGPLSAGRLRAVHVRIGQPVRAGEALAVLDARPLELQRKRLQAELERAVAQLEAERDAQGASLQRGQLQAVRSHAAEERSRAELKELDGQLRRLESLSAERLVRASEVEAVRQRQRAVAADLEARSLGTTREQELLGLRPRTQDEQRERLERRLQPFRAALAVQEAALRELDFAIEEATLRAPVDGTVGALLLRPGDAVGAGAPVLQLVTTRPGHVVAFVPERQARGLAIGMGAMLRRSGALTGALRGRLVELAPMVEEVPPRARHSPSVPLWARRVVIKLDDAATLLPGEAFHVSLR